MFARAPRRDVDAKVGVGAGFDEREVGALELTTDAARLFLLAELMAIEDSQGAQVKVYGVIYRRSGTVRYFALCGVVSTGGPILGWVYAMAQRSYPGTRIGVGLSGSTAAL